MQVFAKTIPVVLHPDGQAGCICLAGAGGKTTLMYTLAAYLAALGRKVLVSTTTHIFMPPRSFAADAQQAHKLWSQGQIAVIGTPVGRKLAANPPLLAQLRKQADVVFLEADGSKGYPCKIPATWEPVIDKECDLVLTVFGLSAIGKPLKEVCFRENLAMALLGVSAEHILTPADAAKMLASAHGGKKDIGARQWCAVLNQCDDGMRRKFAAEVVQHLEEMGEENVVLTAFDERERAEWSGI